MTATEMGLTLGAGVLFAASVLLAADAAAPLRLLDARPAARADGPDARCRSRGRCSPTRAGATPRGCSPTAPCSAAAIALVRLLPGAGRRSSAASRWRPWWCAPTRWRRRCSPGARPPNSPARLQEPVRLLERARPDGGDGRDRLHVAGRPPARARAAQRAGLSRHAALLLLTLLLAYSRGALAALASGCCCGCASCRCACAAPRCCSPAALGAGAVAAWDFSQHALSAENVALAQRTAAGHELGALLLVMVLAARARGDRGRVLHLPAARPAGARAGGRGAAPVGARRAGRARLIAGGARAQPPGLTGSVSHDVQLADQPERQTAAEHPGPPDRRGERARALLEGGAAGLRRPSRARRGRGRATRRRACATARRRSWSRTRTASSCRRSPTSGSSGLLLALALLGAGWLRQAGRRTRSTAAGRLATWLGCAPDSPARRRATVHARADRPAEHALHRGRVRRALADRLDLVRARRRVRGAAVRRLARRSRALERGRDAAAVTRVGRRWRLRAGPSCDPRLLVARRGRSLAALLAAWAQWQPQRSEDARAQALDARRAIRAAARAVEPRTRRSRATRCPPKPLFALADVQRGARAAPRARAGTLQQAVRLQPSNPQTWLELARSTCRSDRGRR